MIDAEILKIVSAVAGIGGISLGVLLIVYREIIRKNIFPQLTKQNAYSLLRLIVIVVWTVALAGIVAWVYISIIKNNGNRSLTVTPTPTPKVPEPETIVMPSVGKSIYREFDFNNKRIDFKIEDIIINNQSDVDDLIKDVDIFLTVPDLKEEDITNSYGNNLKLIDQNGKEWGNTFVLKKSEKVILDCLVSFNYLEENADVFKTEGMRRLTIIFKGQTNPTPEINYCFIEDLEFLGNPQTIVPMQCPKKF